MRSDLQEEHDLPASQGVAIYLPLKDAINLPDNWRAEWVGSKSLLLCPDCVKIGDAKVRLEE